MVLGSRLHPTDQAPAIFIGNYPVGLARTNYFSNRLRANSHDRRVYEEAKRKLAAQDWLDMNAYAQAKSEVIERILAEEWI